MIPALGRKSAIGLNVLSDRRQNPVPTSLKVGGVKIALSQSEE